MFTPLDSRPVRRGRTPSASSVNIARLRMAIRRTAHATHGRCKRIALSIPATLVALDECVTRRCFPRMNEAFQPSVPLRRHKCEIPARLCDKLATSDPVPSERCEQDRIAPARRKCLMTPWRETLVCSFNIIVGKGPSLHKRATIANRTGSPRAAKIGGKRPALKTSESTSIMR
jgi:hypothetical protein